MAATSTLHPPEDLSTAIVSSRVVVCALSLPLVWTINFVMLILHPLIVSDMITQKPEHSPLQCIYTRLFDMMLDRNLNLQLLRFPVRCQLCLVLFCSLT